MCRDILYIYMYFAKVLLTFDNCFALSLFYDPELERAWSFGIPLKHSTARVGWVGPPPFLKGEGGSVRADSDETI